MRLTLAGYQDYTQNVQVQAGGIALVEATMTPSSSPSSAGTLQVNSDPQGANVFLDNLCRGVTPLTLTPVETGSHSLLVRLPGYNDYTSTVTIAPGQVVQVQAGLTPVATRAGPALLLTPTALLITLLLLRKRDNSSGTVEEEVGRAESQGKGVDIGRITRIRGRIGAGSRQDLPDPEPGPGRPGICQGRDDPFINPCPVYAPVASAAENKEEVDRVPFFRPCPREEMVNLESVSRNPGTTTLAAAVCGLYHHRVPPCRDPFPREFPARQHPVILSWSRHRSCPLSPSGAVRNSMMILSSPVPK